MDVIDRVQLTGLGMFGTFTGYRMKPRGFGVSRYPHAKCVAHWLIVLEACGRLVMGIIVASDLVAAFAWSLENVYTTIWSSIFLSQTTSARRNKLGLLMQVMMMPADCSLSTDSERFPLAAGLWILIGPGPRNSSTEPRLTFLLLHFEFPGRQGRGSNWPLFVVISDDHPPLLGADGKLKAGCGGRASSCMFRPLSVKETRPRRCFLEQQ